MFWSSQRSRQRRAVVTALSAVGDNGMSLLALSVAVDIPEPSLQHILNRLVDSGMVSSRQDASLVAPGLRAPRYLLVAPRHPAVALFPPRRPRAI